MNSINRDFQIVPVVNQNLETEANSSTQLREEKNCSLVSFALPVYNAQEKYLRRLIDSLLKQELQDFEIVISDNASDNGTSEICQEYARHDYRIKYHRNQENIGQIANFNKVLELSQGKYLRWIGSDDWLEPDYACQCVEVLEANQDIIAVTTFQDFICDDGSRYYQEYKGERLDSPLAYVRFQRMIWFFSADVGFIDPIYTMIRRETLMKTRQLQFVPSMDQLLSLELSLLGAFAHIPKCLAHRRWVFWDNDINKEQLRKQYGLERYKELKDPLGFRVPVMFLSVAWAAPISNWEKILCLWSVVRFTAICRWDSTYTQLARIKAFFKNLVTTATKRIWSST